jgi:hypothetical protein
MVEKVEKRIKGGKRPGSGRKKGVPNKKTAAMQAKVAKSGITPLDYMLKLLHQEIPKDAEPLVKIAMQGQKFEAAKAAAPYVHPKLANIEHSGKDGQPIQVQIIDYGSLHKPAKGTVK